MSRSLQKTMRYRHAQPKWLKCASACQASIATPQHAASLYNPHPSTIFLAHVMTLTPPPLQKEQNQCFKGTQNKVVHKESNCAFEVD